MIDVALTPADLRPTGVAVVVDVLRATSTATEALAAGYERVLFAHSIERARELRARGRVLAGERRCVMPAGFDHGNSPLEAGQCRGRELVLATTNGARAIVAAVRHAPVVLLGCMLNLDAVIETLVRAREPDVQIVCSGTDGNVALEDAYVAGRLSAALPGPRSDAVHVAESVARAWPTPLDALAASTDAHVLRAAGMSADIAHCARQSMLDVVAIARPAGDGIAVATRGDRCASRPPVDQSATVAV